MLLSLANELKVLPTDLNRLLIIVVVLSMALTPFLAEAGKRFAESTASEEGSSGALSLSLAIHTTVQSSIRVAAALEQWNAIARSHVCFNSPLLPKELKCVGSPAV